MNHSISNPGNDAHTRADSLLTDWLLKLVLVAAVVAALADGAVSLNGF